ncbi:hypothetical protein FKM82_006751 [Ascaphus truei]
MTRMSLRFHLPGRTHIVDFSNINIYNELVCVLYVSLHCWQNTHTNKSILYLLTNVDTYTNESLQHLKVTVKLPTSKHFIFMFN